MPIDPSPDSAASKPDSADGNAQDVAIPVAAGKIDAESPKRRAHRMRIKGLQTRAKLTPQTA